MTTLSGYIVLFFLSIGLSIGQTSKEIDLLFEQVQNDETTPHAKKTITLSSILEKYMDLKDTVKAIQVLESIATLSGHHAKYKDSYDNLWKALALADKSGNQAKKATLYISIGRYYGFYKREKEAIDFFNKSLNIKKQLIREKKADNTILPEVYYAFCTLNREIFKYTLAQKYLDSCYLYTPSSNEKLLENLKFEKAIILSNTNRTAEAQMTFEEIKPWYNNHNPSYLILVETYQGLNYVKMGNLEAGEKSFISALNNVKIFDKHLDFSVLIHEYLSDLYLKKGDINKAFDELVKVNSLNIIYFDSRSEYNRSLLEIQDEFRLEQERANRELESQQLEELKNVRKILFLQRTLLIGGLIFLIIFAYLFVKHLKNKHLIEKELSKKKQELEIEQANEIIEHKNKEMAVSTLKLIEKEEIIIEFKGFLEKNNWELSSQQLKKFIKTWNINHEQNWKEFESRFVEVNQSFYDNLHQKFPDLTVGDGKLCALIKLNFNSKDISSLLGISTESVHTTRYRLRKKLGLSREDNLTEFIAGF